MLPKTREFIDDEVEIEEQGNINGVRKSVDQVNMGSGFRFKGRSIIFERLKSRLSWVLDAILWQFDLYAYKVDNSILRLVVVVGSLIQLLNASPVSINYWALGPFV